MKALRARLLASNPERIAGEFTRLGWIGFWMQMMLATVPVILMIYVLFLSGAASAERGGIDLSEVLTMASLMVLMFTTFWSWRYTRIGVRMADPASRPPVTRVMSTLWVGLVASCGGILLSMLLMMGEVGRLLAILLTTPQVGVPVVQAAGTDAASLVSAIDLVSLKSQLFTLAGELTVLVFTLWLLFRVTQLPQEPEGSGAA